MPRFTKVIPVFVAGLASVFTMTAAPVAWAKSLPGFSMALDVPDDWLPEEVNDLSRTPDLAYNFIFSGSSHGNNQWTATDADAFALARAADQNRGKMKDVVIDTHARAIVWGEFVGYEVFGHGTTAKHEPGKWFVAVFQQKNHLSVAAWILGFGATPGYDKHQPEGYAAAKSVHPAH